MKSTALVMTILLVLSAAGVYATWDYVDFSADPQSLPFDVTMDKFEYKPEEILPGEEEDEKKGNHWSLIERILNDRTYGLNGQRNTIENALKKDGAVYCENNSISGGTLKSLFLDDTNSENLRFLLVYVNQNQIYAYTYSGIPQDGEQFDVTEIVTYKTLLSYGEHVRDDGSTKVEWYASESAYGKAVVCDPDVKHVERSVDYLNWHE